MKRVSSDLGIVIGLLVLVVIVGIIVGGRQEGGSEVEIIPRRTTYSPRANGTKALYTTLHRLGYPVRRHLDKLTVSPADGVLFIISPEVGISQEEWTALQSWVERGNTLILASSKDVRSRAMGEMPPTTKSAPIYPSFLSPGVRSFVVTEDNQIDDDMLYLDSSDSFSKSYG